MTRRSFPIARRGLRLALGLLGALALTAVTIGGEPTVSRNRSLSA